MSIPSEEEIGPGNEIIYMTVSPDETRIGVALGFIVIKDEKEITYIAIYKKNPKNGDKFELENLREFHHQDACISFYFSMKNNRDLLFFTKQEVFAFNYMDASKDTRIVYELENTLDDYPRFGVFNADQTKFIVTSSMDILYVDMTKHLEIDLDDREEVSSIQNIITGDKHFYVLANKKEARLGYYLFSVSIDDPDEESDYLINWTNKLDIGNCDL